METAVKTARTASEITAKPVDRTDARRSTPTPALPAMPCTSPIAKAPRSVRAPCACGCAWSEHTRLRVVESGFPALDWSEDEKAKYAEENKQGWDLELGELRDYVSKQVRESARR